MNTAKTGHAIWERQSRETIGEQVADAFRDALDGEATAVFGKAKEVAKRIGFEEGSDRQFEACLRSFADKPPAGLFVERRGSSGNTRWTIRPQEEPA